MIKELILPVSIHIHQTYVPNNYTKIYERKLTKIKREIDSSAVTTRNFNSRYSLSIE